MTGRLQPCARCGGSPGLRFMPKVGHTEPYFWWYECRKCGFRAGCARTTDAAKEGWKHDNRREQQNG